MGKYHHMLKSSLSQNKLPTLFKKVPEATIFFWITKILTTGMGETTSDFLVSHINPVVAIIASFFLLLGALFLQFSSRRHIPWIYWLTVIMVSIFGTMAADVLHVGLGIPYIVSTIFFAIVLTLTFFVWYATENTLSIHSITTFRAEAFYWATILTTFALGTAVGDLTATTFHWGYLVSGLVFTGVIMLPALGFLFFGLDEVFTFWFAYILTRPLGASFADWIGVSHARGGLAFGTGPISLILLIAIICCVGYLSMNKRNRLENPRMR